MPAPLSAKRYKGNVTTVSEIYEVFDTSASEVQREIGVARMSSLLFMKGRVQLKTAEDILIYLTEKTVDNYNQEISSYKKELEDAWSAYEYRSQLITGYSAHYGIEKKYPVIELAVAVKRNSFFPWQDKNRVFKMLSATKNKEEEMGVELYKVFGTNSNKFSEEMLICRKSLLNFVRGKAWPSTAEKVLERLSEMNVEMYKEETKPYKEKIENAWKTYKERMRILKSYYELYQIEIAVPKIQQAIAVKVRKRSGD